jgi:hypothetical protein
MNMKKKTITCEYKSRFVEPGTVDKTLKQKKATIWIDNRPKYNDGDLIVYIDRAVDCCKVFVVNKAEKIEVEKNEDECSPFFGFLMIITNEKEAQTNTPIFLKMGNMLMNRM